MKRLAQRFALATWLLCFAAACATVQEGPHQSPFENLLAPNREKAASLAAQGNLRGAGDAWKVALTIDPKDSIALEESGKIEERIKQAVADRLARGEDALKRNAFIEARNHFLAVLALEPSNREAFVALQTRVREVRQINHTVRAGESLASIAQLYYGDRSRSEVIWETNQLPPNPKLTPGSVLKIPEIPGLPFGRPLAPPGLTKPEVTEVGPSANPALVEAKEASDRGDYFLALATLDRFIGQNPRSGEALDLKRTILLQQGKTLLEQNKLGDSFTALTQLAKLSPKDASVSSLLANVRSRLVQQHYNQGISLYREERLPEAVVEWRSVLQYDPGHEGAKRNIEQAERLLKGLQVREQKQGR